MILTGRSLCLPSPATVQELFFVARDAGIVPDISLDPVLTSFLSLDSSAALQHQYAFLQRSMSGEQQSAFSLNLTERLGGSRVTLGGVGVVALALSLLFDHVAQQVRAPGSAEDDQSAHTVFGISSSSRIGWIVSSYLSMVPGIANDEEKMAETTELFDGLLKLELLDHYERMTTKKRMSSVAMQQWLVGAAFHLHVRIHQVRLNSVPVGSIESLRRSYKSGLGRLVQDFTAYLYRNIRETAAPEAGRPRTRTRTRTGNAPKQDDRFSSANRTCTRLINSSLALLNVSESFNETNRPGQTADSSRICKPGGSRRDSGPDGASAGLLVIEPQRNVSHSVQHHPCESPAIQQALVTRIMNSQDLERNRNFFRYADKAFRSLLRQRDDFELKTH